MDAPTLQPKFLKNGSDLGIVAVGFSGGQVCNSHLNTTIFMNSNDLTVQSWRRRRANGSH